MWKAFNITVWLVRTLVSCSRLHAATCPPPPRIHPPTSRNPPVDGDRTELVIIEPDSETDSLFVGALENPTFMTFPIVRDTEPVRFLHSAVGLVPKDAYLFVSVEGYRHPAMRDGTVSGLSSGAHAVPAGAGETRVLCWFNDAGHTEELGGIRLMSTTKGGDP